MRGFDELSNAMRAQASMMDNSTALPRFCNISSYDVKLGVKVMIQPENTESGWMPLGCIGVGNGFGVAVGPNIGDFVLAVFAEGSFNSGVIVARFFTTDNQPIPVPAGEIWAVHKTGSFLKFHNDGSIEQNAAAGATYTAASHTFTGPVTMNQTVLVKQTITGQGGMAVSGDNGSGNTSTITGNLNTNGTITNNGHDIGSTHKHINSGGTGLGGTPQ